MGSSDGTVLGLTKIFDSGLPSRRWNLVIVGEGYTAGEQGQFQTDAQDLLDRLLATDPFGEDEVACAINVYRLDVESDESGADDPACDGAGPGTTADTYFDATFCADGKIRRLLGGNDSLVQTTVENEFPEWHQIVVVVNSSTRGGSGGSIAWTSRGGSDWRDIFIHELGHSAFGLADEYDYYTGASDEEGQDNYPGGEPSEPNVTAEPDPTAVKWSGLVTAGTDSPTMDNPDCGEPNNNPSPVLAGTVGTFEGARYYHCDAYRPQYECMMRSTGDDFCAVCLDEIRDFYATYALPAPAGDVTLDTPSVNFNDVPEDVTTQRAATFSVDSCLPVTFQVTDQPASPFVLESNATTVASPSGPTPWKARIWFRYTCDTAGAAHSDTATIRCVETGEEFTVDLVGNCVTRPSVAVQLVFDRSASMLDSTDEGRTKEQVLKDSARAFADLLYDDNGVGLNAYDHDPHPILPVQEAGAGGAGKGRDDLLSEIGSFAANPTGLTAIGDGIELAKDRLDDATSYDEHAMIVLTDGIETADKRIADVADTVVGENVFAIGLGTASQIRPAALDALTNGTGGYLLMTGNLSADDTFLLSKYYLQILAGVNNNEIVLDPEGYLRLDTETRIPFDVTDSDIEITAAVLARVPQAIDLALETPDGTVIDSSTAGFEPTIDYRVGTESVHIRASLPQVVDGASVHGGRWHMLLGLHEKYANERPILTHVPERRSPHGLKYSANVQTYSNLRFRTTVLQDTYEPGAALTLRARLTEYDVPFEGYADVRSELVRPDGTEKTLVLDRADAGVYEAAVTADEAGIYQFRTVAEGRTTREEPFTREELSTAPVWMGGVDVTGSRDGDGGRDELCRLSKCLVESDALGDEARAWLKERGLNVRELHRCLCEDGDTGGGQIDEETLREVESVCDRLRKIVEDSSPPGPFGQQ